MSCGTHRPVAVTLSNDHELIAQGLAAIVMEHPTRVEIVEVVANGEPTAKTDVALHDTFAASEIHHTQFTGLLDNPLVANVAIYTWHMDPELIAIAERRGVRGYISKSVAGDELVDGLVAIGSGSPTVLMGDGGTEASRPWPGHDKNLTEGEAEVLAMIADGLSNLEIVERLYLGPDAIKWRIRNAYRKIAVENRVDAVRWCAANGLLRP